MMLWNRFAQQENFVAMVAALLAAAALGLGCGVTAETEVDSREPREDIEVIVSEARTAHAASPYGAAGYMVKLADGSVVNWYWESEDEQYGVLSRDEGKTWKRTFWPGDSRCVGVLSDGTVIAIGYIEEMRQTGPGQFVHPRWISRDHWETWEGPLDTPVHIPGAIGMTGDDLQTWRIQGPLFWRSLLELPDGRLVAAMYGNFEGDTEPIILYEGGRKGPRADFKPVPGFNKTRTFIVESKDRGASWSLLATVAYDPEAGQEGYCEPALAQLPSGELLCIMRTGYTHDPMYTSRSSDGGRTWSQPVSTRLTGVNPNLLVLDNDLVACSYGVKEYEGNRRERRIMFSTDGGYSWSHNTLVFAGAGGSYSDAVQLESGRILYTYDVSPFVEPDGQILSRNYLRAAFLSLRTPDPAAGLLPFPIRH